VTVAAAYLETLNPEQRRAVEHGVREQDSTPGVPLLVIAGAGSGKTNTLAHRVAHLIVNGADPRRILLMTFSRRAAVEMTRRVERISRRVMGQRADIMTDALAWAGTFHGIGARLLRDYADQIGLEPNFTIHDREDSADLMNLVRHNLGFSKTESRFPTKGTCLAIYSRAVNSEAPLDDVLRSNFPWCAAWEKQLRELFAAYVETKQQHNVLDYDDLLLYWAQAVSDPLLAEDIGGRWDHVLVDEYQDTNRLQSSILLARFLRETIAATRQRLQAGDVTPTDLAQTESRLSRGLADLNSAEVNLAVSRAAYRQVIGARPGRLAPTEPIDRLLPRTEDEAVLATRRENPAVLSATYDVDVAQFAIKVAEGALYPTINAQGTLMRQDNADPTLVMRRSDQASLVGQLNLPIYDGGLAAAQVRQAKEMLTQTRIGLDRVRLATEAAAIGAWEMNEGAKVGVRAAEAEVRAATIVLDGVQRETRVGQRSILELLNSQQELVGARSRLIVAQRDRFVASYTLLSAVGRLDHQRLGLPTPSYEPQTHYQQVRDAWHGLRTPSGQ
jgi:TolC family type I secretion outer membrane protein